MGVKVLPWDIIYSAIGGLGMFLFGMQIMASGLQKAAGSSIKKD